MGAPKELFIHIERQYQTKDGTVIATATSCNERQSDDDIKYIRADLAMEKEELDYLIKECVDCLRQCRATLLKLTALDSSEELHRKEIENECALTRRIDSIMGLIDL